MSNQLAIREDIPIVELGQILVKSGFFADSRDASQAIVKVLAGRELGFGAIASMTGVNIIKGRVALSANLIAAAIKRTERYTYRLKPGHPTERECTIDFYERANGKIELLGTSTFSLEDAKRAGLAGDNWNKYTRNMLFARAISNGAKWYCPDIFGGPVYTPDELGAPVDGETGEIVEVVAKEVEYHEEKAPEKPTQKAWDAWHKLVREAQDAGMPSIEDPGENVTLAELDKIYRELQSGIKAKKAAEG